jgi:hypothetical protein
MNAHEDHNQIPDDRRVWIYRMFTRLHHLSPEVELTWQEATKLIGGLKDSLTDEQRRILNTRWVGQTKMYERLWRGQRTVYYLIRVPIILGAATVPVIASLSVPRLATALLGLMVASLTGLDSFFQLGSRWQQHRHAATALGFEGWEFLELTGSYAKMTRPQAFEAFVKRLESMNKSFALSYLDLFRAASKGKDDSKAGDGP